MREGGGDFGLQLLVAGELLAQVGEDAVADDRGGGLARLAFGDGGADRLLEIGLQVAVELDQPARADAELAVQAAEPAGGGAVIGVGQAVREDETDVIPQFILQADKFRVAEMAQGFGHVRFVGEEFIEIIGHVGGQCFRDRPDDRQILLCRIIIGESGSILTGHHD